MSLSWRARRRWALVVLLVGLPAYVALTVTVVGLFERPGILAELAVYLGLGLLWILPLRFVFRGVGRTEQEADGRRS
jgi:hypothetical protein